MSTKTVCDICSEVLPRGWEGIEKNVHVNGPGRNKDYCIDCWKDERKWKKIHKVDSKKT